MKQIIILIILVIIAGGVFCWPKSKPEICSHVDVSSEQSIKAISSVQNAFRAFDEGGLKKAQPFMVKLDSHGYKDQKKMLEQVKNPRFDEASVDSPKFDNKLFYVYVPTADARKVVMVCRLLKNEELKLVSVSWIKK